MTLLAFQGGFEMVQGGNRCSHGRGSRRRCCIVFATMLLLVPALAVSAGAADNPIVPPDSTVVNVDSYNLIDTLADPVSVEDPPASSNSTLLWGYEANFGNSRILSYNITPYATGPDCVPDGAAGGPTGNGRGVAYDPLDGNLWIT